MACAMFAFQRASVIRICLRLRAWACLQLRSVLREARVSTGQLAHTPALHLKASQPGSVLASIRPQQSGRGMTERVPVSTRLVTEAASLRTVGKARFYSLLHCNQSEV